MIEDAPAAAIEVVARGIDFPAVVELAGMDGASWSEVETTLSRVYPVERGAARPADALALALVTDAVLRAAVDEKIPTLGAIRTAYRLSSCARHPDGTLSDLMPFDDYYDLVADGIAFGEFETTDDVLAAFLAEARRVLAAGGAEVPSTATADPD